MAAGAMLTAAFVWNQVHTSTWRAVVVLAFVPLEAVLVFAAAVRPVSKEGTQWHHRDLDELRTQLRVRTEVRIVNNPGKTSGGSCQHRWGRDVVVLDAGLFSHHEQLAVAAHEFGHTKQSPLVAPMLRAAQKVAAVALWVGLLPDAALTAMTGLTFGLILWLLLLYVGNRWVRVGAMVLAWGWWLWITKGPWVELAATAVLWVLWRLGVAYSKRVSEHHADEAARAVAGGPEALSAALARLSGSPLPWWRQAFSSHPVTLRRGANRG